MGDIADMVINGLMCETCGCFFDDGDEPGYPRSCCDEDHYNYQPESNEKNDEDDDEPTIETITDNIDDAITYLEMVKEDLSKLKNKKSRSVSGLIKNLELFKQSLGANQ